MFKLAAFVTIILTLTSSTNQACLSSSVYTGMGFTALTTSTTTNVTLCPDVHSKFGRCVEETALNTTISFLTANIIGNFIAKGNKIQSLFVKLSKRLTQIIANADKISKNETLQNVTIDNSSNTNAAASRLLQSGSGKKGFQVPGKDKQDFDNSDLKNGTSNGTKKVNSKNMKLDNSTLTDLKSALDKLTIFKASFDSFATAENRQKCESSIISLNIGSMCVITSGAATDQCVVSGNKVTSVNVTPENAKNLTLSCLPFIYSRCVIDLTNTAILKALSRTSAQRNTKLDVICTLLNQNPSCASNATNCTVEIQNSIATNAVQIGNDAFSTNFDSQDCADNINSLDLSLNSTITNGGATPSRRLQAASTTSVNYGFAVSSSAIDLIQQADASSFNLINIETQFNTIVSVTTVNSTTNTNSTNNNTNPTTGSGLKVSAAIIFMMGFLLR